MRAINNELVNDVPDNLAPENHDEPIRPHPHSARGTAIVDSLVIARQSPIGEPSGAENIPPPAPQRPCPQPVVRQRAKRYAIIKFYIHHRILAIRPHRPSPPSSSYYMQYIIPMISWEISISGCPLSDLFQISGFFACFYDRLTWCCAWSQ